MCGQFVRDSRILLELLLVVAIAYVLMYFLRDSAAKGFVLFLPVAYALLECHFRHRSWKDLGVTKDGFAKGILVNWHLFLIVVVALQLLIPWMSSLWWPDYLQHILSRLPLVRGQQLRLFSFLALTAISTFVEELVFRGLIQERLGWFIPQSMAIVAASVFFGIAH